MHLLLHINRLHLSANMTSICTGEPGNSRESLHGGIFIMVVVWDGTHSISDLSGRFLSVGLSKVIFILSWEKNHDAQFS